MSLCNRDMLLCRHTGVGSPRWPDDGTAQNCLGGPGSPARGRPKRCPTPPQTRYSLSDQSLPSADGAPTHGPRAQHPSAWPNLLSFSKQMLPGCRDMPGSAAGGAHRSANERGDQARAQVWWGPRQREGPCPGPSIRGAPQMCRAGRQTPDPGTLVGNLSSPYTSDETQVHSKPSEPRFPHL